MSHFCHALEGFGQTAFVLVLRTNETPFIATWYKVELFAIISVLAGVLASKWITEVIFERFMD